MVTIIRDRVQAMMKKGMTLEQVKAARPTEDWMAGLGKTTGPWTTEHVRRGRIQELGGEKVKVGK